MQSFAYIFGSAAFLIASNVAFAENCSGSYTTLITSSETLEVAKGHSVTFILTRSSTASENYLPLNAVGECGGYGLNMPDGKTLWSGICTRKGSNGDSESDAWSLEPGAERGTWKLVAGTGAFAGKSNSGWFQTVVSDGKTEVGKWGGNCQ